MAVNSLIITITLLLAFSSLAAPSTNSAPTFDWSHKPQLTDDQSALLHLYNRFDAYTGRPEMQRDINDQIDALKSKLGTNTVRYARADELIVSKTSQTNACTIFNSTQENLVFTVSIKGDEEWDGSRKASIGRQTFLPPHGTLLVTNVYWTTPKMKFTE